MRLKVRITVLPDSPFNKPVLPPFQNCHFFACSAIRQGIKSSGRGSTTNLRCTAASPSNVERIDSSEVESIWTRSAGWLQSSHSYQIAIYLYIPPTTAYIIRWLTLSSYNLQRALCPTFPLDLENTIFILGDQDVNYPTYPPGQLQPLDERVRQIVTQFLAQAAHASIVFSN